MNQDATQPPVKLPPKNLPISPGIVAEGKFLFVSGQGPYDPATGGWFRGSIGEQTRLTLECIRKIVEDAGATMSDLVSCRVFLQQITETNFAEMNAAFVEIFGDHKPSRTTVGCQLLNIDVEIDCIVKVP